MFAVCIAFVCFYHAERVLSAIAKFLAYHFGQREGRGEIWDRGKRVGENGEDMKVRKMGIHEAPQQIWHLGTPLAGYRPCHTFYTALLPATFASQRLCLCLVPFRLFSFKVDNAPKMLNFNIFVLLGKLQWGLPHKLHSGSFHFVDQSFAES